MPNCLGIYIEDRLIKYAKVSKERDSVKVEAFDTKFYENIEETLEQIIQETNSYKCPIAINVSDEVYNYFDVFSLLSSSDIKKSIDIEFEMLCSEKGYNKDLLEPRYLTLSNPDNLEKLKIVNVSVGKAELSNRVNLFDKGRLASCRPLPTSVLNLVEFGREDNSIIVNIEDKTYMTIIENGNFNRVEIIPEGMGDVLDKISRSENSYSKAYEICKNTTISSHDAGIEEGNEYLEMIMPTLYTIADKIKSEIDDFDGEATKIYITGSGSSINNIDLFMQDYLGDVPCEILKPKFLEAGSLKIGIKEYIEVNSAIALALDGLGMGIKDLNFVSNRTANIASVIGSGSGISLAQGSQSFTGKLDPVEKLMLRVIGVALIFLVGYAVISNSIVKNLEEKSAEADSTKLSVMKAISDTNVDDISVESITKKYQEQIDKLRGKSSANEATDTSKEVKIPKDTLPNFLSQIMFAIPQNVTIDSITNTSGIHIAIQTSSKEYQQIGLFKAILYNKGLLKNVTSTGSVKEGEYVKVTIEGDLP